MWNRRLSRRETDTLKVIAGPGDPSPEETARALAALQAGLDSAALRLGERRAERRTLLRQALALAGCMALFALLSWVGYQNREVLSAKPAMWPYLAGFALLSISIIGCLPILSRKGSYRHE